MHCPVLQIMEAQDGPVKMCPFARNGTKILSCDVSGRVYVWSVLSEVILSLIRKCVWAVAAHGQEGHVRPEHPSPLHLQSPPPSSFKHGGHQVHVPPGACTTRCMKTAGTN